MMKKEEEEEKSFRDSISTVTKEGSRAWVYPKKPKGRFYNYRKIVSYSLLLFLFASPFIKVNGNQFLLFNVLERRFNIFGVSFWPQDFYLFVISMITGVVFITLFTVAFGRVFCGWICPQTIFLEMVFRRIEYWIEGDRNKQRKLNRQVWNAEKVRKRILKWFTFLCISFLIANIFLAYLIGSDKLLTYITDGPSSHLGVLFSLLIFTAIFYFIFTWFREQVCTIVCPYGRLQGVLLDNKSIIVTYDHRRGEDVNGRKTFRKNEDRKAEGYGDCIDCSLCVDVCPTGIDIRNGTQLECVNCTACIDECNYIMERINLPKGLIRYASEDEIEKGEKFKFTPRIKAYTTVLVILIGILSSMLLLRSDVEARILRLPGQLYEHKEGNIISNVFTYRIINKTENDIDNITLKLKEHKGEIKLVSATNGFNIPNQGLVEGTLFIEINEKNLKGNKNNMTIEVYSGNKLIKTTSVNFFGPRGY